MRQVRGQRHHAVVLVGIEDHRPRADALQPRAEFARGGGLQLRRLVRASAPRCGPRNRSGSAAGGAALLLAGHGMAAQELAARMQLPRAASTISHLVLPASVTSASGPHQRIEMADGVENAADGLREEDQVGLRPRPLPAAAPRSMAPRGERRLRWRAGELTPRIAPVEPGLPQRQPERAADQPDPDNGNGVHVRPVVTDGCRPTVRPPPAR